MEKGMTYTESMVVEKKHLACEVGSGDLEVLSTPSMMAFMEHVAMKCVAGELPDDFTTVGGYIESKHMRPTAPGETITATATIIEVEGAKIKFAVQASDSKEVIGKGTHIRYVVNREKFMSKL